MIEITSSLSIDESEIQFDFVRSSGPGGQNVNKVSTGVQLRFDVRASPSLPGDVKMRLDRLAGSRMTADGVLVIDAHRYRTQDQNRADALMRLISLLTQAAVAPRPRHATRPTQASRVRRLEAKHLHSAIKHLRRTSRQGEE